MERISCDMGTKKFPHLHEIISQISFDGVWRIFSSKYIDSPLGMGYNSSRFSAPNKEFKVLYVAGELVTADRETIVRDYYDDRTDRFVPDRVVKGLACTRIVSRTDLFMVNLTDGNASNLGIPSKLRHEKEYNLSQALSIEVYQELPTVDGIFYNSRLDDKPCFVIFDRAVKTKLLPTLTEKLVNNSLFWSALREARMQVRSYHGRRI